MAFVADPAALRTRDPERGLELISGPSHPDGTHDWWIVCRDGSKAYFNTVWEQDFADKWLRLNPDAVKPAIYLIRPMRGIISGHDRKESDSIIVEALTAFQGFHGKPGDATVAIFFEPSGLRSHGGRWWENLLGKR